LPQIMKIATDKNGASAISYSTWSLWVGANLSTSFYAAINLHDFYPSAISGVYAMCCVVVILLTIAKRRRLARKHSSLREDRFHVTAAACLAMTTGASS
jgi:hypothetical protein